MTAPIAPQREELDVFDLEVRTVPASQDIAESRLAPMTASPGTCESECGLTCATFPGC